jgi:3'-5' exoribonuclease
MGGRSNSRAASALERWRAMTGTEAVVIRLSDLVHDQEAVCFAALVRKTKGMTKSNQPYMRCVFRDSRTTVEAPLWSDSRFLKEAESWIEGSPYRLEVRGKYDVRYGMQVDILGIRPATEDDAARGFDFGDLYEQSHIPADELLKKLRDLIERSIDQPPLRRLVQDLLDEHLSLFKKMPAAQSFHHAYTSGLLEHIWSMTRIACFLADHYAKYYDKLDPPLNRSVVMAATILHDIGKLRELEYHPVEARYTTEGRLIGHILIGRDMVRQAAGRIEGFPEELLLRLEHAILAHHGKREFGAPVLPQTLEALLVSHIDDLDAKMNIAAGMLMRSGTSDGFTERIYALDNRQMYKGLPEETPPTAPPIS